MLLQGSNLRQIVLSGNFFTSIIPVEIAALKFNLYLDLSGVGSTRAENSYIDVYHHHATYFELSCRQIIS